jgi:hypothetical protein
MYASNLVVKYVLFLFSGNVCDEYVRGGPKIRNFRY